MATTSPFPDFTQLTPASHSYTPPPSTLSTHHDPSIPSPDLLILCPWMAALPKHINKYVTHYRSTYPNTPILLITEDGNNITWRPYAWQITALQPSLTFLHSILTTLPTTRRPRILLHSFSNGGACSATMLAHSYALQTQSPLPLTALIIDSAPSTGSLRTGMVAFQMALPDTPVTKYLGPPFCAAFYLSGKAMAWLTGKPSPIIVSKARLNAVGKGEGWGEGVLGAFTQRVGEGRLRRLYLFSDGDALVKAEDVVAHAREAREVLDEDVEKQETRDVGSRKSRVWEENFGDSAHVGHMRADPERYWKAVKDFWATCIEESER